MNDQSLADRLVGYSDAVVAVAFVGMSGLSLALADPDVRCSMANGAILPVSVANVAFACFMSLVLLTLRRWELDLRSGALSSKASRYSVRLHTARISVVWLSAMGSIAVLAAASNDPSCGTG